MSTPIELKEKVEKWYENFTCQEDCPCEPSASEIADFFLSLMSEERRELEEKIDKMRKRTVSKEHYPQMTDNKIHDRAIYNQAVDDILSLLKGE